MSEELFDLIFQGEIVKNVDEGLARKNVQQLFKIPAAKVDALFSGNPVVLKRGLNMDVANKYRVAIKKAGALVNIVAQAAPVQKESKQESHNNQEEVTNTATTPVRESQTGFSIAPVGADVLTANEREAEVEKTFDLSAFSVRNNDGPLLDVDEILHEAPLDIEVDWSVAPAGSELLAEDQKEHNDSVTLDLSALSLAEVGVTLVEAKEDIASAPDVSHLSLKV